MQLVILSRNQQNKIFLNYVKFIVAREGEGKAAVKVLETVRSEIKVVYPKALHEKVKNNMKAAMTVKMLGPQESVQVVLTGKLGEIFTIDINRAEKYLRETASNSISIKAHSIEEAMNFL